MDVATKRIHVLHATGRDVSAFVLSHFLTQNFTISSKLDGSVVTNVDTEAELMARQLLLEAFPEDGFLGEEHGEIHGKSGYRWVVDPIDGTASFARGVPLFGTLIGLEYEGIPIAGFVCLPALGETISAVVGEGVIHQGTKCAGVSSVAALEDAMICTTTYDYYKQTNTEPLYQKLLEVSGSLRGWSDCYAYMLLCTGRIDAVVEPLLFQWDIVPWLPIIEEAGGNYSPIASGGIASNHTLHNALCHALSCAP
ncbi:MAG: histidinol phosphate phosphatase [Planctomycetes bacterium]|nr:histidinol phosphate phosphatase [Planctomycetota bacterium]